MTQTVKYYVELTDLDALRVECKHCSATVTLPLVADSMGFPNLCPNCQSEWSDRFSEGPKSDQKFKEFFDALRAFRRFSGGDNAARLNFTVSMQVKPSVCDRASSSRDA